MRKIKSERIKLIAKLQHLVGFFRLIKRNRPFIPWKTGNPQAKILRILLIIPFVLFLEAEYFLLFNYNTTHTSFPIKISTLMLGKLDTLGTVMVHGINNLDVMIDSSGKIPEKYIRFVLNSNENISKGVNIFIKDSVPANANLKIKWRGSGEPSAIQINILNCIKTNETAYKNQNYYYFTSMPQKEWTSVSIPLTSFFNDNYNSLGTSGKNAHKDRIILELGITFYSKLNTSVDLSDIRFEWKINNMPNVLLLLMIISVGIILFIRTSGKNPAFEKGWNLISNAIASRLIYFIVAISAFISLITNAFPLHHHQVYLVYTLFLVLICIDEFYSGVILGESFWSLRYLFLIIVAWFYNITDNVLVLSTLTLASYVPVIQHKKRLFLLCSGFAALLLFLTINKYKFIVPDFSGVLIIVGATAIAVLLKEMLEYELTKYETNHARFLYENLFENSYDGIYTTDIDGRIESANYGFGNLLGYSIDEIIGKNILNFVYDEDHPILKQLSENALSKDLNYGDINFIDVNGELHTSLIRVIAIFKNNEHVGYQSIATDITERKHAEQELLSTQSRYKALISAIPDLVLKFSKEGILLDYHVQNDEEAGKKYYEEFLGNNIYKLFEPNIALFFLMRAEYAFAQRRLQVFEYEYTEGDRIIYEEARIVPLQNDQFISIIRDITARKQAEFQIQQYVLELDENRKILERNTKELSELNLKLEEINKSKDKFFSIVAHDLRSPFTGLLGFSDILSNQIEFLTSDEIKTYSSYLNHSLKNVFKLLENLLDWSRIQTGKIKVSPGNFDLNSLIQQIIGIFQINASEKKINIDTCIEPCLKTFADKDLVDTVVRNLLSNAIKFTRPGGNIRIQAFTHDGYVEVGVSDNGIGILPENLSKLFRIDETVSTEGTARETGTGLGLVLCKEFIEKNGGKISVESKMNEGSKFSFTLPGAKD